MGHAHGAGNLEAANQLAAEIKAKWPTGSIFDWSNEEPYTDQYLGRVDGPRAGQLFDARGEHLLDGQDDYTTLQGLMNSYGPPLGWLEAEHEMQHFFSVDEARDVTDGESGWTEVGFKHPAYEYLYRATDNG